MIFKQFLLSALCTGLALTSCASPMPETVGSENSTTPAVHEKTTVFPIAAAAAEPVGTEADERFTGAVREFSEKLFAACAESGKNENLVLSPLSVICALTLVSNGASDTTLQAFEDLNGGIPVAEMNEYLYELAKKLGSTAESTVDTANSVWANEPIFTLSEDFVTVAEKYYDALAKSADFADAGTLDAINQWVSDNTDGMIKDALTELDPATALVLLNTVLFNGKWEEPYEENDVRDGKFTNYDGTEADVEYMDSTENSYFEVDNGVGFVKAYKDGYSFVGILPDEDIGIEQFTAELDLTDVLSAMNDGNEEVRVFLPKFEYENELPLKEILAEMGLDEAFSGEADLNGLGGGTFGNPYISDILQKAKIITDENGTKAAAVTEVMIMYTSLRLDGPKEIRLNRPFFYMILENETQIPLFMGTVYNLVS